MKQSQKLMFASDYQEGAHPNILKRLAETNMLQTPGYGLDEISISARNRIRRACGCPQAEVEFLVGGTQTNACVIDALLANYQGVIAAESGHISVHEAGAIEFGGHKVLPICSDLGKISAEQIGNYMTDFESDVNRSHMVMPGMVYLSQPTEFGTLYSLQELQMIRDVCSKYNLYLYVDGARLAYALASSRNNVTLRDLADICDVFYIGGTKCGALFGEAVVIPNASLIPHFFTIIKQHGALLAKGRILGIQFDELFKDDLYLHIGEKAVYFAEQIKQSLVSKGFRLFFDSPANQIFFIIENSNIAKLSEKAEFSFWEKYNENHTVLRCAVSWATSNENVNSLCDLIDSFTL